MIFQVNDNFKVDGFDEAYIFSNCSEYFMIQISLSCHFWSFANLQL